MKPRLPTLSPRRLMLISKGLCEWGWDCCMAPMPPCPMPRCATTCHHVPRAAPCHPVPSTLCHSTLCHSTLCHPPCAMLCCALLHRAVPRCAHCAVPCSTAVPCHSPPSPNPSVPTALFYGTACITVAALASLLGGGVLQVSAPPPYPSCSAPAPTTHGWWMESPRGTSGSPCRAPSPSWG